jgi:hypothetical protein
MSRTRVKRTQKLLPTNKIGTTSILEDKSAEEDMRFKEGLPIINCECGTEILVLPDLQSMNRAIKTHVSEHRKKERKTKDNIFTTGKIFQLLSQLTLLRMSEKNDS